MRIISPDKPVKCDQGTYQRWYHPFCRYVVSDYESLYLQQNTPHTNWTHSSFNPYERRPGGSDDLNGKKVCVYRHTAYGDQLMISSVPKYIKSMFPDAIVHLYCDEELVPMWRDNPYVGGSAIPIPIPFDVARGYDYHIFYEGMLENNGEPDQECCYDDFFRFFGHIDVPDFYKRPFFISHPSDYEFVNTFSEGWRSSKIMVYHQSPANRNRAYPFHLGADFIRMFLREKPEWKVIIVGDNQHGQIEIDDERVLNICGKTKLFRFLAPVLERCNLFVGPDSSIAHLVACFPHVPSVTLWGLFHPNDRVKYYPNSWPIFLKDVCPHAPCHNHDFNLPLGQCRHAKGFNPDWCSALAGITPEMIMKRCIEALR